MTKIYSNERKLVFDPYGSNTNNLGYQKVVQTSQAFSLKPAYDDTDIYWVEESNTNGVSNFKEHSSERELQIGSGATDIYTTQTVRALVYIPGNVHRFTTAITLDLQSGATLEAGVNDDCDGALYKFHNNAGTYEVSAIRRTKVTGTCVDNEIPQSQWNLDKLDGSGPSGITADWTKIQMVQIEYTWYGAGGIAYAFQMGRKIIYVHWEQAANNLSTPIFGNPDLPVRFKLYNESATAGDSKVRIGGLFVGLDSSLNATKGHNRTAQREPFAITAGNEYVLLSIRPKTHYKSQINRAYCKLEDFQLFGSAEGVYKLILAGSLTGDSWQDVHFFHSMMEYDISATAIDFTLSPVLYSGGISAINGKANKEVNLTPKDPLTANSDGSGTTPLSLWFKCTSSGTLGATLNWTEYY